MQEMQEIGVWSLNQEDPLEEGMATHSSILAWRIPWAEEPGGLQSMGSQRVRNDWVTDHTHTHTHTYTHTQVHAIYYMIFSQDISTKPMGEPSSSWLSSPQLSHLICLANCPLIPLSLVQFLRIVFLPPMVTLATRYKHPFCSVFHYFVL